jgi:hypothetical protein
MGESHTMEPLDIVSGFNQLTMVLKLSKRLFSPANVASALVPRFADPSNLLSAYEASEGLVYTLHNQIGCYEMKTVNDSPPRFVR